MYQPIEINIGLRYLFNKSTNSFYRFISWFSAIGIMISIIALIMITSVMNGFKKELKNNIINHQPQGLITSTKGWISPNEIEINQLPSLKNVKYIKKLNTSNLILQSSKNITTGTMFGVHQNDITSFMSHHSINNNINKLIPGEYQTIISQELAHQLHVKKNDIIRLIVPDIYQNTLIGKVPRQRLFIIVGTFITNDKLNKNQLLTHYLDASKLMGYPAKCYTGWQISFKNPLKINNINKKHMPDDIVYKHWYESKGNIFQAINMEQNMMTLLITLIIIMASSNIITSISMLIVEKQTDIAILQIQGCSPYQIMLILITYGMSTSIMSIIFGTILGIILTQEINNIAVILNIFAIDNEYTIPTHINTIQIIIMIISIIIVILLSILYPAWKAIKMNTIKKLNV